MQPFEQKLRGYQIPLGENTVRVKSMMRNDENSRIDNVYQVGPASIRSKCLLQLIKSILHPKAFDFLRNKQQLGYSVGVRFESEIDVYGLSVYVSSQETKHSYQEVYQIMELFMNEHAIVAIRDLEDEEFENFKDSLIKTLSADDLELADEVGRNWKEITKAKFTFNRNKLSINALKSLTKFDLQAFFESFTKPEKLRKLNIQVIGKGAGEQAVEIPENTLQFMTKQANGKENLVTNVNEFKKNLIFHPESSP